MICDQLEVAVEVSEIDRKWVHLVYVATCATRGDLVYFVKQFEYIHYDETLIIMRLLHAIRSD